MTSSSTNHSKTAKHILVAAHHWYHDAIGGSFRLATQFAEYLASRGYKVSYLCCAPPNLPSFPEVENSNGIEIWRYAYPGSGSGSSKLKYHLRESARLASRICNKSQVDSINGHSPLQFLGVKQANNTSNIFSNYTVHSPFDDELLSQANSLFSKAKKIPAYIAARWIERRNLQSANIVQTDSRYTLDRLRSKFPVIMKRKELVLPGWVDTSRFAPASNRQAAKERLGRIWTEKPHLFLTVRRLEQRMGLDTLVDAAALLSQERSDFRVVIGGGGPLQSALEDQVRRLNVADHVHFCGRLPEAELPIAYAGADCFVLPTRALECFGLIVLESFSCRTPVLATDVAAIPELAGIQGEEWLFPVNNAQALAEKMELVLSGKLTCSIDLRNFAERYEIRTVQQQWEQSVLPS